MNVGSNKIRAESGVLSEPFAFLRSGRYYWHAGSLLGRSNYTRSWSSRLDDTGMARHLSSSDTYFYSQDSFYIGTGFPVRWEAILIYYCLAINEP